jgi:hypothetical protein
MVQGSFVAKNVVEELKNGGRNAQRHVKVKTIHTGRGKRQVLTLFIISFEQGLTNLPSAKTVEKPLPET